MLIIRDLIIHGPRTYSELLESPEHIATNILAHRLNLLVSLKLIERENPQQPLQTDRKRGGPDRLHFSGPVHELVLGHG